MRTWFRRAFQSRSAMRAEAGRLRCSADVVTPLRDGFSLGIAYEQQPSPLVIAFDLYQGGLQASGGLAPYRIMTDLDGWLALANYGERVPTPYQAVPRTATVVDRNGATASVVVDAPGVWQPAITSSFSASAKVGVPFGYQITATQFPTSYDAVGFPPDFLPIPGWLSIDHATGLLTGTPPGAGTVLIQTRASNQVATGYGTLVLSVSV